MKLSFQHKKTLGALFFFIAYLLYMWLWINPSLYLIRVYSAFFTDDCFLREYLDFPGNPATYVTRFITQLYQFPFVASLLITLILGMIYLFVILVFKDNKFRYEIGILPVFVLMLMHNDYRHSIRFDLDIFMVYLFVFLCISSFRYRSRLSHVLSSFLLIVLLYLNGVFAALLFICLFFIVLIFSREKNIRFIECSACVVLVFIVFHYLFNLSYHDLHQEYVDTTRIYSFSFYPFILYASVLIMPVLVFLLQSLKPVKAAVPSYITPIYFLALLLTLFLTSDREEKRSLSVQHYALNGNWEKALTFAGTCKYPDKDVILYTNQALYFTGKMYDDLFLYNQSLGSEGLLSTEITNYSGIVPNQDVFLHLGAISLSIIWGTEATNVYGANPYVLKNLVKAYLAGGYIIEADKILNQLDRTPFQQKWVRQYRIFVNDTTLINKDAELRTYKQVQAPVAVVSTQNTLMNLFLLMKDTKANRMAYDYLLTASLLDHKIAYFASYLTGLEDYGYTSIPKIYFEGLVYNSLYSPQSPVNIRDFSFDPDIMYRFDTFRQDLRKALQEPESAPKVLEDMYKDTYWYYLLFRSSLPDEEKLDILNRLTM